MSNEQRAHDITMLYVKIFTNLEKPNENGNIALDPCTKYCEIYPTILEKVNENFPQ